MQSVFIQNFVFEHSALGRPNPLLVMVLAPQHQEKKHPAEWVGGVFKDVKQTIADYGSTQTWPSLRLFISYQSCCE